VKLHPLVTLGSLIISSNISQQTGTNVSIFTLPVEVELGVVPYCSLYGLFSPLVISVNTLTTAGVLAGGGARVYISGNAPQGFWLGAQVEGATVASTAVAAADFQGQLGYQWVSDNGFTFGLGAGVSFVALSAGTFPLAIVAPLGFAW